MTASLGDRKRKKFSHYAIANYWMCYEQAYAEQAPWSTHGWDWGEPACMACGHWQENWDDKATIVGRWNSAGLEKCHVIPFTKGYPEQASNMVLMCSVCHLNNPETDDPEIMYAYMRQRTLLSVVSNTMIHGLTALVNGIDPLKDIDSFIESMAGELHVKPKIIRANLERYMPELLERTQQ